MLKINYSIILVLFCVLQINAQEISEILDAHFDAAAQEKMQKVKSMVKSGKLYFSKTGIESSIKIYQSRPDKLRIEGNYMGAEFIQYYDGESAWKYAPAMGADEPVEITGKELEMLAGQVQFENPLWKYSKSGASIVLEKSDVENNYRLSVIDEKGTSLGFLIDKETFLISKIIREQGKGDIQANTEILLSDYRMVRGIPMAFSIVTRIKDEVVSREEIDELKINKKIDFSLFQKPVP